VEEMAAHFSKHGKKVTAKLKVKFPQISVTPDVAKLPKEMSEEEVKQMEELVGLFNSSAQDSKSQSTQQKQKNKDEM